MIESKRKDVLRTENDMIDMSLLPSNGCVNWKKKFFFWRRGTTLAEEKEGLKDAVGNAQCGARGVQVHEMEKTMYGIPSRAGKKGRRNV